MTLALKIVWIALGFVSLVSFFGGMIAGFFVAPYYDDGKKSGWFARSQYGANPALSRDHYQKEGWPYWQFRDRCLKIFAISAGLLVVSAVIAAVADIKP